MFFKFENDSHRYEIKFVYFGEGEPYVIITTRPKEKDSNYGSSCTGFSIKDNQIVWVKYGIDSLHLTPEMIDYVDRLMRLKMFW